jgi:hypothetical protein
VKVSDSNFDTCDSAPFTVTVTSATTGDSETLTLIEISSGSGVFMNTVSDLVTTATSAVVTSASSTFVGDGVMAGDRIVIGTGSDAGTYTVSSVDSETQITLTSTLSTSSTGIVFTAQPVLVVETGGSPVANDGVLEAVNTETLTVTYVDCDDGDPEPSNDAKTDTALAAFAATFASIEAFTVSGTGKGARVQWRTAFELGTLGFDLLRSDASAGDYRKLNKRLLPGLLHSRRGGTYRFADRSAENGETYDYLLVEKEADGGEVRHGPYTVTVADRPPVSSRTLTALPSNKDYARAEHLPSAAQVKRAHERRRVRRLARAAKAKRRGMAVKIPVTESGIHFLAASQVASQLGLTAAKVEAMMRHNRLALFNRGRKVATLFSPRRDGLYFYGEGIASIYTSTNVYWLRFAKGRTMKRGGVGSPRPVSHPQHHLATAHAEGNRYTLAHLFDDPEADYWMWDFVFPGFGIDSKSFNVVVPDPAPVTGNATLVVRLLGGNTTPASHDHHAIVSLNGVSLGAARWDGTRAHTASFEFPVSILDDGDNEVRVDGVLGESVPYSVFYVNDMDVIYPRRYRARQNRLEADTEGHRVVTIEGFDGPEILAFDITDAASPKWLKASTVDGAGDAYRLSLDGRRASRIAVLAPQAALSPVGMLADRPSALKHPGNRGSYLILTSSDMLESARRLARHRARQGHAALVVDIEDVYDEFSHGIADPNAIWSFLAHAHGSWRIPPRYVVLAGDGSHDYRDHLGFGDSVIPTLLVPTPDGLFPSDNLYGDVLGNDWVSEIAVGRLTVIDADELDAVIDKIVSYEAASGVWTKRITLAAGADDEAGNFVADSEVLAAKLPEDYAVERIYLDRMSAEQARAEFHGALTGGRVYVNFIGHGGITGIGNAGLLDSADVAALSNGLRLPVFTAASCLVNQFALPGFDALGEHLITAPDGGAIAVWSASGLSINRWARELDSAFYEAIFEDGERRLGDAIINGQRRYASRGGPRYLLDIYNLLGDPALVLK